MKINHSFQINSLKLKNNPPPPPPPPHTHTHTHTLLGELCCGGKN